MAESFPHITILQFVSIMILWQIQNATCIAQCQFPSGSIACKIWNNTNMDCSQRELVCIPQLHHKASLELLDLSHNKLTVLPTDVFLGFDKLQTLDLSHSSLSSIQDGAFNELHNLISLDLSGNNISIINEATFAGLIKLKRLDLSNPNTIPGTVFVSSPFQDLGSLETLIIYKQNSIISASTFSGLNSLQELHIFLTEFPPHNFLTQLPSLLYLFMDFNTCNYTDMFTFNGVDKLEYLSINLHTECRSINVDFCPLQSLQTLDINNVCELNLTDQCLQTIPLKSLELSTTKPSNCSTSFQMLNNLSSLTWTNLVNSHTFMQALSSIASPLQDLTFYQDGYVILNSTTFESCQKWTESLQKLKITTDNAILIEGAPFKWFPKLLVLRLSGQYYYHTTVQTLSNLTFSGLSSLKELRLNFLHVEFLPSGILDIFSFYNSLKILDLSQNDIYDDKRLIQICNIKSLEELYLSNNKLQVYFDAPCILPNLKILDISNQRQNVVTGLYFDILFTAFPDLNTLLINHCSWTLRFKVFCPNLFIPLLVKYLFHNNTVV